MARSISGASNPLAIMSDLSRSMGFRAEAETGASWAALASAAFFLAAAAFCFIRFFWDLDIGAGATPAAGGNSRVPVIVILTSGVGWGGMGWDSGRGSHYLVII